jgi:hypothetical protein
LRQLGPDPHSGCGPRLTAKCPIPASFLAWSRTMRRLPCRSSQTEPICPPGHSTVSAELRGDLLDVSCSSSEKMLSSSLRLSEWIAVLGSEMRIVSSAASAMCSRLASGTQLRGAIIAQLTLVCPMKMNDSFSIGIHSSSHWPLLARWPLSRGRFLLLTALFSEQRGDGEDTTPASPMWGHDGDTLS